MTPASEQSFQKHVVAAPVGQAAWGGTHATLDGDGNRIILVKLWAGAGSELERTLLWIDAVTGKSTAFTPPDGPYGEGSFGTFLSRGNCFYDMVAKGGKTSFYEFDVASRKWTTCKPITLKGNYRFAMSFTETDDGMIYAGILTEGGGLLSFDPKTKELRDLGRLLDEDWLVYPSLISDNTGWIYAATKHAKAKIIAWHPQKGKHVLDTGAYTGLVKNLSVSRAGNGRAYIQFVGDSKVCYEAYDGKLTEVESPGGTPVLFNQGWRSKMDFGDGTSMASISVPNRKAVIVEKDGSRRTIHFDYQSKGVPIYTVKAGEDGKIYGATGIPLRFFRYDPASGTCENNGLGDYGGHINDLTAIKGKLYGAIYSSGALIEIDSARPWEDAPLKKEGNPRAAWTQPKGTDIISRPFVVHAHRDGEHCLVGGNPYRVASGGGLLICNLRNQTGQFLYPTDLIPGQGVKSLVSLEDGTVIGGSTIYATVGGTDSAEGPGLFVLDWESRKVTRRVPFPTKFKEIQDLVTADGKEVVYGIATGDATELFRLQQGQYDLIKYFDLSRFGKPARPQGSRILSFGPDGRLYILFASGIVEFDTAKGSARLVDKSPAPITTGGSWSGDRLYFGCGPNLWSWSPAVDKFVNTP